ncbi:MAG: hypothetical protein A3G87_01000 [Omnitrophica bacterium RIFCSPLOWO2_12_FULL_50_11]|nr:MAG: hypothetical protein A3G87_01000 [Omnitrophica bacterium RIFCSPLOWO2_12_FULL_50_11]
MSPIKGQYVVDAHGHRKAVLLNLKDYARLMKIIGDIRDVQFIHRHRHDKLVPMHEVHNRLKK